MFSHRVPGVRGRLGRDASTAAQVDPGGGAAAGGS
nr:MAG TPA: hypothetical protein [Caudoviricetes sp.]